ncbi:hypothetical protein KY289_029675 [Solanum tuberosum]|nr:hypothetical protein KY289_029675 [Solanum tuberosum]
MFPGVTQYEVLQNICGNVRDFHGLIVNGCIKHGMVENVLPLFQLMAERVGRFLWEDQVDVDSQLSELDDNDQNDRDSRLFKLAYLLLKIVPTELELLETSPDILQEYLIHLQEHMETVITSGTLGARNIHVMIEFLLIVLSDMPKDFIHHDKLFDLLELVGALIKEKQLFGKRYLIVLDDAWDTNTWDDLTRPFPDGMKGSRIILTTREKEVALHGKLYTAPLNLRLLRSEESWELLEKRAFGNESCPNELLDVGKEIAENCKGLPLVVDLIAGVIAGSEKKKRVWLEVVHNLHSFILKNEVEVMKAIEISYDHLPDHLKPCLLYFASKTKDLAIPIFTLNAGWVSEGLAEKTEMKCMEEVVKIYLDDCFNEIGQLPTCQIHDLVHNFCLIKAREEKLFDKISSSAPSNLLSRQITIDNDDEEHFGLNSVLFCSNKKRHSDESILTEEDTKLENLRILAQLVLSYSKDTEDVFKRLPNLQVLEFELKESWDYSTEQYWFPKLDFLTELEELTVGFESSNTNDSGSSAATNRPWDFHFPSSLKKLWLYDFPLTSDSLSTIAILSNLEELTLCDTIIQGGEWNMGEEDTFENLKCLELDRVTLSKWEVGEESFPALEKLKLEGCCDLEEIPPSFGDIYSLKIITLVSSPQLEDSAMKIKEYAEDMRGGDELQVVSRNNIPLFK